MIRIYRDCSCFCGITSRPCTMMFFSTGHRTCSCYFCWPAAPYMAQRGNAFNILYISAPCTFISFTSRYCTSGIFYCTGNIMRSQWQRLCFRIWTSISETLAFLISLDSTCGWIDTFPFSHIMTKLGNGHGLGLSANRACSHLCSRMSTSSSFRSTLSKSVLTCRHTCRHHHKEE